MSNSTKAQSLRRQISSRNGRYIHIPKEPNKNEIDAVSADVVFYERRYFVVFNDKDGVNSMNQVEIERFLKNALDNDQKPEVRKSEYDKMDRVKKKYDSERF